MLSISEHSIKPFTSLFVLLCSFAHLESIPLNLYISYSLVCFFLSACDMLWHYSTVNVFSSLRLSLSCFVLEFVRCFRSTFMYTELHWVWKLVSWNASTSRVSCSRSQRNEYQYRKSLETRLNSVMYNYFSLWLQETTLSLFRSRSLSFTSFTSCCDCSSHLRFVLTVQHSHVTNTMIHIKLVFLFVILFSSHLHGFSI